jgi:DNA uptake protein ComE-like DNA-binding protein
MSTEILETSPLYQLWVSEATEKGMAQGLREAVLAVLHSRFGEPAPEVVAAINGATVEQLRELLNYVGTESLEQITQRLGEHR